MENPPSWTRPGQHTSLDQLAEKTPPPGEGGDSRSTDGWMDGWFVSAASPTHGPQSWSFMRNIRDMKTTADKSRNLDVPLEDLNLQVRPATLR